jgi:hypothetical protein
MDMASVLSLLVLSIAIVSLACVMFAKMRFVANTMTGLHGLECLIGLIKLTQQHRGSHVGLLNGNQDFVLKIAEIDRNITHYLQKLKEFGACHKELKLEPLHDKWKKLQKTKFNHASESFKAHTALITLQLDALWDISDSFALTSSHDNQTKLLATQCLRTIPELAESLGQVRALTVQVAAGGEMSSDKKLQLYFILSKIELRCKALAESEQRDRIVKVTQFADHIKEGMTTQSILSANPEAIFAEATSVINDLFAIVTDGLHALEVRTNAR